MSLPSWVPDDEVKPAPFPLLLVQSFVNTWEGGSGADLLAQPAVAKGWLSDAGLVAPRAGVSHQDLTTARDVRESIRALLVRNAGGPAPTEREVQALRELSRAARFEATIGPDGHTELQLAADAPLKLAKLLVIMRDSQRDGTWARLKACQNGQCLWAFYDRSHARRGAWCDMAVCGNRLKNRNLRRRRAHLAK